MLYCQTTPISKTLGQFENLVFVIMSTRENIRLIARSSFIPERNSFQVDIGAFTYTVIYNINIVHIASVAQPGIVSIIVRKDVI